MKKIMTAIALSAALLCASGCRNSKKAENSTTSAEAPADSLQADSLKRDTLKLADLPAEPQFDIVTTMGTIRVKLYADTPKHRDNFAKLALEGFYDGILFHRVIEGFMIQGGDPLTKETEDHSLWGTGGPGYTIPAEIVADHVHKKGALAAARRGDIANPYKESSGSQFYIVHDGNACFHLNGEYSVFGETVDGFDVIDKIASTPVDRRDCPLVPVKIIKVIPVEE